LELVHKNFDFFALLFGLCFGVKKRKGLEENGKYKTKQRWKNKW